MRARKSGETDAAYIARLEAANSNLRQRNGALAKENEVFVSRGRPAAAMLGLVVQAAAEVCGMDNDPAVSSCLRTLNDLAALPWRDDIRPPDAYPIFLGADPTRNGGDCEMLLRSASELVLIEYGHPIDAMGVGRGLKQREREWLVRLLDAMFKLVRERGDERLRAIGLKTTASIPPLPDFESLAAVQGFVQDLSWQLYEVWEDVEMSRSMLRLDLRSAMYDNAFRRIGEIVGALRKVEDELPRAQMHD